MSSGKMSEGEYHNKPCAAAGLVSYRAKGRYGWVMIGAVDDADAAAEASRSTDNWSQLQRWNGTSYVNV